MSISLCFTAIHQKLESDGTEKVEGSMTQRLENVLNSKIIKKLVLVRINKHRDTHTHSHSEKETSGCPLLDVNLTDVMKD